jgi:signal transduction histidine kinase
MDVDTTREFVTDIGNEADRLNRMSQRLLTLLRVDDQSNRDCEIQFIAPSVKKAVRMLYEQAKSNDVNIECDLSEDCPILIYEDDLYQIIFNLLENGIKYNVPGGTLTLSLSRHDDNAVIKIRDTGVGIPEDSLSHIFERFYRVDKARSRSTGGSGLGLSIVRNMVERNHGEIKVASEVGKGTTFTLSFPIFETEEGAQ